MRSLLGARATTSVLAVVELPAAAGGGLAGAAADDCDRGAGALALVDGGGDVDREADADGVL